MLKRALAAAVLIGVGVTGFSGTASAAAAGGGAELVCLDTYSNAVAARNHDAVGITAGSVMPRETAAKLVTDYEKIYAYPDQASMISACQCLHNPAPAHTLAERDARLKACPKPTRIE